MYAWHLSRSARHSRQCTCIPSPPALLQPALLVRNMTEASTDKILKRMTSSSENVFITETYAEVCRLKSVLLLQRAEEVKSVDFFTDSFGVTVRQRIMFNRQSGSTPNARQSIFNQDLIKFSASPKAYLDRLHPLPAEWTIVQVAEVEWDPCDAMIPPDATKPLLMSRLGCGDNCNSRVVRIVPKPLKMPDVNKDAVSEILQLKADRLTAHSEKEKDKKKKLKINYPERFEKCMVGLRDWLGAQRCLLLGRLVDKDLERAVNDAVAKLARTLHVPAVLEQFFGLLVQGAGLLSEEELAAGLTTGAPPAGRGQLAACLKALLPKERSTPEELGRAIQSMRALVASFEQLANAPRHPVILILSKRLFCVSWEMLDVLQGQPVTRMPSLALAQAMHARHGQHKEVDPRSVYYVVNPDNNLPLHDKALTGIIGSNPTWRGTFRQNPDKKQLEIELKNHDLYLYAGHNGGLILLENSQGFFCRAVSLLMGCRTSDVEQRGLDWEADSPALSFLLAGSPCVVSNLWIVHDLDSFNIVAYLEHAWLGACQYRREKYTPDRYSSEFMASLKSAKPSDSLLQVLSAARSSCPSRKDKMGACVAVGLPVQTTGRR